MTAMGGQSLPRHFRDMSREGLSGDRRNHAGSKEGFTEGFKEVGVKRWRF